MSAQNELSPCRCTDHYPGSYLHDECRSCRALGTLKITREELATMRAAVERCAELEAALVIVRRAYEIGCGGTYGSDGSPYALAREIEKSGLLSDTPTEGETK